MRSTLFYPIKGRNKGKIVNKGRVINSNVVFISNESSNSMEHYCGIK